MAASLLKKLNQIYKTVDHIEKNGWNEKQRYKFVRATDLAHAVRNAFADAGIYAEVNFEYLRGYEFSTTGGSKMQGVDVKCNIIFHDIEGDPAIYHASGIGSGSDGLDKASFKAQTGALKYALRNAFIVPDEADPENDDHEEEPSRRPTRESAPAKTSTTKTTAKKTEFAPSTEDIIPADPAASTGTNQNSSDEIPTEDQKEALRNRYKLLVDDLSSPKNGKGAFLVPATGFPVGKQLRSYLLKVTGADDIDNITRNQWNTFFEIVSKVKSGPGIKELVRLVKESAGIKEEKK